MTETTTKPQSNRPRCIIARDGVGYYRRRELDTHGLVGYRAGDGTRALLEMGQYRAQLRNEHGELLGSFALNGTTYTVDCRSMPAPSAAELEDVTWGDWKPTTEYGRLITEAAEAASAVAAAEFRAETQGEDATQELYGALMWQTRALTALSRVPRPIDRCYCY